MPFRMPFFLAAHTARWFSSLEPWYDFLTSVYLMMPNHSHTKANSTSKYFLGDPPPDPRFLASLGALSLVELDHCSVLEILTGWTGPNDH